MPSLITPASYNPYPLQLKVKQSDESKASQTALSDDADLVGFTIRKNTFYRFGGYLYMIENGGDFKFAFNASIAPQLENVVYESTDTASARAAKNVGLTTAFTLTPSNNVSTALRLYGFVLGSGINDATWDLQWAQNTSSANVSKIRAGSWVSFREMP